MLYVALVAALGALGTFIALSVSLGRAMNAYNYEMARAIRAETSARDWRLLANAAATDRDVYKIERDTARIRLQEIRVTVTRRPLRRRWLRLAHRVAILADTTTRGVRWPA